MRSLCQPLFSGGRQHKPVEAAVAAGVIRGPVLPVATADPVPGLGQDADGVRTAGVAAEPSAVDVGGPRAGVAAVCRRTSSASCAGGGRRPSRTPPQAPCPEKLSLLERNRRTVSGLIWWEAEAERLERLYREVVR